MYTVCILYVLLYVLILYVYVCILYVNVCNVYVGLGGPTGSRECVVRIVM